MDAEYRIISSVHTPSLAAHSAISKENFDQYIK